MMNYFKIFEFILGSICLFAIGAYFGIVLYPRLKSRFGKNPVKKVKIKALTSDSIPFYDILSDIELGVIVFDKSQALKYKNKASIQMFPLLEGKISLDDFLTEYGEDNGLKTRIFLKGAVYSEVVRTTKASVLLDYKEIVNQNVVQFYILIAYDVTVQENEAIQRKQFVSNVSHELKTPITIIKSYAESLIDWGISEKNEEDIKKDVNRIYEDADRMQKLVNDLSLLTSLDSGGIHPMMAVLNSVPIIHACVERQRMLAEDQGIELNLHVMQRIPDIFIEKSALERIVINLLSNAIKYTKKHGTVDVFVNKIYDEVYIKVVDNGIGISEENIKRVFDRFFRVDETGSTQFGGTGLGLAITSELVDLHAGRIILKSALGKGSEFMVILPSYKKLLKDSILLYQRQDTLKQVIYEVAIKNIINDESLIPRGKDIKDLTKEEIDALVEQVINI